MVDYPASYHGRAAGFSFADGHSEMPEWRDPNCSSIEKGRAAATQPTLPHNPDVVWMQDHSTRLK